MRAGAATGAGGPMGVCTLGPDGVKKPADVHASAIISDVPVDAPAARTVAAAPCCVRVRRSALAARACYPRRTHSWSIKSSMETCSNKPRTRS